MLSETVIMQAWIWPPDVHPGVMAVTALDRLSPPDLQFQLHGSTGDTISVVADLASAAEVCADDVIYIEQRGSFRVVRREGWPSGRVLLTLAAWPTQ